MRAVITGLALGCLVLAGTLRADEAKGKAGAKPEARSGLRFSAEHFIKDYDKNGDGKLSKDELPPDLRKHFSEIDRNKDGFITAEELRRYAHHRANRRPRAVEMVYVVVETPAEEMLTVGELQEAYDALRKLDTNHDGKISPSEVAAFRKARMKHRLDTIFNDLDRNKDGKISKEEARGLLREEFDKLDTNKDGSLERSELEKAFTPPREGGTAPRGGKE